MDKLLMQKFQALSDPTRMAVIEQLLSGPASVSSLAEPFEMSLPPFIKHLRVLEKAELVHSTKEGRVRTYRIHGKGFDAIDDWVNDRRLLWHSRLIKLENFVQKEMKIDGYSSRDNPAYTSL